MCRQPAGDCSRLVPLTRGRTSAPQWRSAYGCSLMGGYARQRAVLDVYTLAMRRRSRISTGRQRHRQQHSKKARSCCRQRSVVEPGLYLQACAAVLQQRAGPCGSSSSHAMHHNRRIDHPTSGSDAARARRCTQSSVGPHGRPAARAVEDAGHAVPQRDGRVLIKERLPLPGRYKSVLARHGRKSSRRLVQRRRSVSRTLFSTPVSATNSAIHRGHGARGVRGRRGGGRVPGFGDGAPVPILVTRSAVEGKSAVRCLRDAFADKSVLKGLATIYAGAGAVAMRQATNWASRQGLTDLFQRRLGLPCWPAACSAASGAAGTRPSR